MQLRVLSTEYLDRLLEFEIDNRTWFESHIEARADQFYSRAGVEKHIEQLTEAFQRGEAWPGIIEVGGEIVGRVNLTKMAGTKTVGLGYRVGRESAGKGVASFAVARALEHAYFFPGLTSVSAFVSVQNRASQRVLEKSGFRAVRSRPAHSLVGGSCLTALNMRYESFNNHGRRGVSQLVRSSPCL